MNQVSRKNILILDPDRDIGELFARALEARRDCKCYFSATEEDAIDLSREISFELVLIDLGLAMAGDFSLLKKLRRLFPDTIIIIDAYLHQKQSVNKALTLGAHGYLFKPIKVELLRKKVDEICVASNEGVM